jgi:excisionase family DNA binding protein
MAAIPDSFTPKQIARALGVSESSLKRWCDQGVMPTVRTVGGHRRIPLSAVLEYLRSSGRPLVRPEVLGLPATSGKGERVVDRAREKLQTALIAGDAVVCRQVVFDLFLANQPISAIGDRVIRPAFDAIGQGWACGDVEVFEERRACEIMERILHELEAILPASSEAAPLAMGGTVSGDAYDLANTLVAMVVRQAGWRAISLGKGLPLASMLAAIRKHQPRLFWVSISHLADEAAFLAEFRPFAEEAQRSTLLAVGGRAVSEALCGQVRVSLCGQSLQQFETLLRSQSPS